MLGWAVADKPRDSCHVQMSTTQNIAQESLIHVVYSIECSAIELLSFILKLCFIWQNKCCCCYVVVEGHSIGMWRRNLAPEN